MPEKRFNAKGGDSMKLRSFVLGVLITFACLHNVAHAARVFKYVQSPDPALASFNMGSTQTISYQITNTSTGGNIGERIYLMQFNLPGTGTVFSSSTTAPAGWTRTAFSSTSVSFQANSWSDAIAVGGPTTTFPLVMVMGSSSADVSDSLKNLRASYTNSTTGPPFSRVGRFTINTTKLWTLKSLAVTSFIITDTLGNPATAIAAGNSFKLVMTVKNNSTVSQSGIISNPNPPTPFKIGPVTQGLTSTVGSPLTLAAGASGTITFTYSTAATDNGTIYFTANAQSGANVTSNLATSTTVAISKFIAAFAPPPPACLYAGSNITVTMTLTNEFPYSILNITPTLAPVAGAPLNFVSGPTPATIASLAAGASTTVTWVYQVNSTTGAGVIDPFTFSGSATGTGNTAGSPTITTPLAISSSTARGEFLIVANPSASNTSSTNVELIWTLTNNGCAPVNSVTIPVPAGWVWANDAYSLVNLSATSAIETWVVSGTNPVTFTSPDIPSQLPQTLSGNFHLVFSATPTAATTSIFSITVMDANGASVAVPVNVTVNAFKTGGLNNATNKIWREDFR
jgi:hypothetical protein